MRWAGIALALAAAPAVRAADFPELAGKVLFGWQGWHACPGEDKGTAWTHWTRGGAPTAANLVVDMYPDLSEFEADELCPVPGFTVGGRTASLFSARHPKSVDRHFRWMKDYGLDGVLVQRFLTEAPGKRRDGDVVLRNAMAAALKHGRAFAVEYDLSGHAAEGLLDQLKADWAYLVDDIGVTRHPGYLHHRGRPVLGIWGMGLDDGNHHPTDPVAAAALVRWFRQEAPAGLRVAYMGGVPTSWRTLTDDAREQPAWEAVYDSMDIVQPWTVGRYRLDVEVDSHFETKLKGDLARTRSGGRAYQAVVWPGFSWVNLNQGPANQIPRRGGAFLWKQAVNAKRAGAPMLKIAMFDEVDESTAMYKLAARRADAPDQGYWLTLDADGQELPSDWYLKVANAVTRMWRGEIPATDALPIKPGDPWVSGARAPEPPRGPAWVRVAGGIRFAAERAGAEIVIEDLKGREVAAVRAEAPAVPGGGPYAFWDGTTASGSPAGPGVYRAAPRGARAAAVFAWAVHRAGSPDRIRRRPDLSRKGMLRGSYFLRRRRVAAETWGRFDLIPAL